MANPKLLGLELSEAEAIGADSARFEELLLQLSCIRIAPFEEQMRGLMAQTPSLEVVFLYTGLEGAPASPDNQTRIDTNPASAWFLHKDQLLGREGFHQHLPLPLYPSSRRRDRGGAASDARGGPSWVSHPHESGRASCRTGCKRPGMYRLRRSCQQRLLPEDAEQRFLAGARDHHRQGGP
ncbi:PIH1 domain-containing protein 1 isoform X2 [Homo sapiens]|uniref:PIH1 domain-containing protein 1 isoform X2 n=1 Tax=Homo sapiens TaxID=9606 RepID=UPI00017A875D|nr:PIH1 domain-containing protein 1 isoform X2 [Homo sapiens]BAG65289.1 unnamed protein product [Homo sapiens]